jgi:wobble nucleotide-excising tRNase
VRIVKEDEEVQITFDSILGLSNVDHSIEAVRNKQSQPTPLCKLFQNDKRI